jgi:hypothetical protein
VVENRTGLEKYGDSFIHIGSKGALWIKMDASVVEYLTRFAVQVVENRTRFRK